MTLALAFSVSGSNEVDGCKSRQMSWRAVEILATREAGLLLQATQDSKGTIAL